MKKLTFLLAIASFLIVSCNSDNGANENSNVTSILPRVITVVENGMVISTSNYFYNGNKILRIENTNNYNVSKTEFTYSGNLITSERWYNKPNGTNDFELSNTKNCTYYDDNRIKTMQDLRPGIIGSKFKYTYPSSNKVLCSEVVNEGTQEEKIASKATINMVNGNVASVDVIRYDLSTNLPNGEGYSKVCLHDGQKNIKKNIIGYNQRFEHTHIISVKNNLLGGTTTDLLTGVTTSLPTCTIIYNSNGYPTTVTRYRADGTLWNTLNITY